MCTIFECILGYFGFVSWSILIVLWWVQALIMMNLPSANGRRTFLVKVDGFTPVQVKICRALHSLRLQTFILLQFWWTWRRLRGSASNIALHPWRQKKPRDSSLTGTWVVKKKRSSTVQIQRLVQVVVCHRKWSARLKLKFVFLLSNFELRVSCVRWLTVYDIVQRLGLSTGTDLRVLRWLIPAQITSPMSFLGALWRPHYIATLRVGLIHSFSLRLLRCTYTTCTYS